LIEDKSVDITDFEELRPGLMMIVHKVKSEYVTPAMNTNVAIAVSRFLFQLSNCSR